MAYDIARAVETPDIIGNALAAGMAGRQMGLQDQALQRKNALAGLASQAYTAPAGEQRNALVAQAVGVDPGAGFALGDQLAARDTSAASAQEAQLKKVGGAARYMMQAIKTGNPAAVQGAYQVVRPFLAQMGSAAGKVPPEQYDPSMEAGIQQLIAATGGMPEQKGVVLSAGGQLRNPMTGELLADNPQSLQYHDVPMGAGKAAGVFDPSTGQVRPAVGGMQPAGDPMQPFIDQANQAVQLGADPAKVEQWLMQQAQQIGAQPQGGTMGASAGGNQLQTIQDVLPAQFGVGTPKPSASDQESFGAPQQVMGADGKPHLMQFGNRGGQREVQGLLKPEMTAAQAAKLAVQQDKAAQAKADTVQSYNESINAIDQVLNSPGANMLGTFTGDLAGMIPHSDTADAEKKLDVIKNQVLLNTISKLKALSATGASGFGSLSNQEGEILKNSIANLSTKQSNRQLIESLNTIKTQLQRSRDNIAGAQIAFPDGAQSAPPASGGWSATRVN